MTDEFPGGLLRRQFPALAAALDQLAASEVALVMCRFGEAVARSVGVLELCERATDPMALAEALDEEYLMLAFTPDGEHREGDAWMPAFERARAAMAFAFSRRAEDLRNASHAAYEAAHALGDNKAVEELRLVRNR